MAIHECLCCAMSVTVRLLKHGELVGIDRRVLVNSGLDMPAGEIAAVTAGKGSGPKAADWNALPVTVIDVSRLARHSRIF